MHRWLVRQLYRFPLLRPVLRWTQIEYGAAVHCVAGIPCGADRHFGLPIAVQVRRRNAHMVLLRKLLRHDVFGPRRIFVPDDQVLVREQNVRLLVTVDVRDRYPVADLHLRVHVHRFEDGLGCRNGRATRQ